MSIAKAFNPTPFPPASSEPGLNENPKNERHWDAVLYDGQSVQIRQIRKQDVDLERQFIEQLSATSRRFRFLGTLKSAGDNLLRQWVVLDPDQDLALVAVINDGVGQSEVGIARLSTEADDTCELAVTVSDEWQNMGLGTLLMQHLICSAIERGIKSMHSIDAADCEPMREFAACLGFERTPDPDDATRVLHRLDLSARRPRKVEIPA
jgi:GNAT superfamily N-acetyltransferase